MRIFQGLHFVGIICGAGACAPARAEIVDQPSVEQLSQLSIEELAQVEVTAASKRAEPLSAAPAAVYVITEPEIARSPATSLPDLLRQAPNLQTQQIDARSYAITARGFNGAETANKLLALIDGRSIYTPLFSGIFWELHNPLLEDLHQIEVVSGPGGTLFGPNAVNGVVSITTKDARDTLGGLARATAGARERTAAVRYGFALGDAGAMRVYASAFERQGLPAGARADFDDDFRGVQAGFRLDYGAGDDAFTLQGDVFDTDLDPMPGDGDKGHNILARWTKRLSDRSSVQVRAYYDSYDRRAILVRDSLDTFDLETQFNATWGAHDVVLGAGVRTTKDLFDNDLNAFVLNPESKRLWVANFFGQDRIALNDRLSLILGLKAERSSFSGIELLPNVRLAWQPNDRTLLWSAVSRAVRTPSRIDRQLENLPLLAQATEFESEKLIAFEAGYRGQPSDSTTLSVSVFYNLYDDIRTTEFTGPTGGLPIRLANSLEGETYGVELWGTQQIAPWWQLRLGLATLGKNFHVKEGHVDLANRASLGNDPDFKATLRSQMDLTSRLAFDFGLRASDDLDNPPAKGYIDADARLAWRATDGIELYVAGNNLLHDRRDESGDPKRAQSVERTIYAGTRVRF